MHSSPSRAQAVAVATPCWPAPVSAITRGLPIRLVSSAWPMALRILCAPVWFRSSRFSRIRAPATSDSRVASYSRLGAPMYSRSIRSNSPVNSGSAMASRHALVSSSSGAISASGMNLPPKRPKCPSWSGSTVLIRQNLPTRPWWRGRVSAPRRLDRAGVLVPLLDGGMRSGGDEVGDRGAGIAAGHQGFTDEDDIGPGARKLDYIMRAANPGLRHPDQLRRDGRRDPGEGVPVDLEGLQVAVVHADELSSGVHRTPGLLHVLHLDQRAQPDRVGPLDQRDERLLLQRRDDQQHHVGTRRPRLPELVRRDDEVLAQHGYVDPAADRPQVVQAAVEPALLGQHRDRRGATLLVLPGQCGRIGDLGQIARGRAGSLHLGDDRDAVTAEHRHRVLGVRLALSLQLQVVQADPRLALREVGTHPGENVVKHSHVCPPLQWSPSAGTPKPSICSTLPASTPSTAIPTEIQNSTQFGPSTIAMAPSVNANSTMATAVQAAGLLPCSSWGASSLTRDA